MRQYAPLLKLIRNAESGNNYDAFYAFKNPRHRSLTEMSLAEVRAYQEGFVWGHNQATGGKRKTSTAAGAYQIIRKTLDLLITEMRLPESTIFDRDIQDAMAIRLLERRGLRAYEDGIISTEDFAHSASKEWASLPRVLGGKGPEFSYYAGDGLNHARVEVRAVMDALDGMQRVSV